MTDPVTNVEIEDVLSSIRRLVSENARSKRAIGGGEPKAPEDAEAVDSPASDAVAETVIEAVEPLEAQSVAPEADAEAEQMLVLTPALRVAEAVDPDEDVADETGAAGSDELKSLIEEVTEQAAVEAAIRDVADEAAADEAEAEPGSVEAAGAEPAPGETLSDAFSEDDDLAPSLSFLHSDHDGRKAEMATLEDRIAGLEAAVAEREDDWEPDGISENDNAGEPVESLSWEDSDIAEAGWERAGAETDEDVEDAELVEALEADTDVQEAQAEEGYADIGFGTDDEAEVEPELEDLAAALEPEPVDELSTLVEDLAADAEAEADPELMARSSEVAEDLDEDSDEDLGRNLDEDPADEPAAALFREEDAVIDEATLRDLVAEIVRQELQGTLGERITRNVRKLVRREIHRAITARDLD